MHKKPDGGKSLAFVITATLFVLVAVVFAFWGAMEQNQRDSIVLPDGTVAEAETPAADVEQEELFLTVEPDNIQKVLSTMASPQGYTQIFTVTSHWAEGNSESQVTIWRDGDLRRADVATGDTVRHLLTDGASLWLWYGGDEVATQFVCDEAMGLEQLVGIPTYESLTQLPASAILQGQYLDGNNTATEHALYITASQWDGVETAYWVDATTQILVAAQVTQENVLQLTMAQTSLSYDDIDPDIFATPDGITLETGTQRP